MVEPERVGEEPRNPLLQNVQLGQRVVANPEQHVDVQTGPCHELG
jgi:hypothetical protein